MWKVIVLLISSTLAIENVDRTNNGIFFEAITEIDKPMGYWTHSFGIPVPRMFQSFGFGCNKLVVNLLRGNENGTQVASNVTWFDKCVFAIAGSRFGTWNLFAASNPMNRWEGNMCRKHKRSMSVLMDVLSESCPEIMNIEASTLDLLPKQTKSEKVGKRGLVNAIGEAAHYLFGIATAETTDNLEKHIAAFAKILNRDNQAMKSVVTGMQTLSRTTDERIKNILTLMNGTVSDSITQLSLTNDENWNFALTELQILRNTIEVTEKLADARAYIMMWLQAATD